MSSIKADPAKLLELGAHFGHQSKRWNPKMEPYLYKEEKGIHLFDLIKTEKALNEVLDLLSKESNKKKTFLFVGTKKQVKDVIKEVAEETGSFYVNERWLGGTLTNFKQIKKSVEKLEEMKEKREKGEYDEFTKKERLLLDREIARLERFFQGIVGLDGSPDYLIVVDVRKEKGAVVEARRKGVKIIGIVDSNSDPDMVDYVVPMNDDAIKPLEYVLHLFGDAIMEGKKSGKTDKKKSKAGKVKSKTKRVKKVKKSGGKKASKK